MNILVCVKQVPDTEKICIDRETNTLVREGAGGIVNPFDTYALEAAAQIKDRSSDTKIVVAAMGVWQARTALAECLAIAADEAYLINDKLFAGSDTFATSYILSEAVKIIEEREGKFDALFCGKQAVDGDTAQVGPELAEHLGYPQITGALEAEKLEAPARAGLEGLSLRVLREFEQGRQRMEVSCPCVITFTKSARSVRVATLKRKLEARKKEITVLTKEDIPGIQESFIGLSGSPTRVKRTFVPPHKKSSVMIEGAEAAGAAERLLRLLRDERGISL